MAENGSAPAAAPLAAEVRRRLVHWMLLPSLVAVLGLGLAAGWSQREEARSRQAVVAQAAAFLAADYMAEARSNLAFSLLDLEANPGHAAEAVLALLNVSFRQFERLLLLDREGLALASAPPGSAGAHFPLENLGPSGSGAARPILSPHSGLPTLYEKVSNERGLSLVAEISMTALQSYVSRLAALTPGEEVALTDAFGNVLAHPDLAQVATRANIGHLDILRRARDGGPEFGDYQGQSGLRIGTAVRVPDTGWLLLVSQPAMAAYGPIAAMVLTLFTALAGLFLLLVLLTERTLRLRVAEPLAEFSAAVQDIGRGQMRGKLPPRAAFRELSLLMSEFDNARQALATRDAALRASEAKYREIFENSADGLFQSTPEGRYASANPALSRMLGYGSPAELMAEITDIPNQLYADPAAREELLRLLDQYGEVKAFEARLRRRDGALRWCSVNARATLGPDGRVARIEGAVEDIHERKRAEERLRSSLREKEVLLKEVHHRVKNNLQVVSGLLFLQADSLEDPAARAALEESQNRIASMALAHEALYGSDDMARVDLKDYVDRLMSRLVSSLGDKGVRVAVEVSAAPLPLTKAVPCGLILNELVTNALKYAFDRPGGTITVATRRDGPMVELSVADNGRGLPAHITPENAATLGLQLVANLTAQLRGTLRIGRENGTVFVIRFPMEDEWRTS
ncbi:MAG: histidine kinase dimerization/phosphoacceptor domain -containing protein [Thermodesulfobacteriota bacterium]